MSREVDKLQGPQKGGLFGLGPLVRYDTGLTVSGCLYKVLSPRLSKADPLPPSRSGLLGNSLHFISYGACHSSLSSQVVHTVSDVSGVQSHRGNRQ